MARGVLPGPFGAVGVVRIIEEAEERVSFLLLESLPFPTSLFRF